MVNNICMLSTHGYFDPIPQLGRTDTGGQVTYVIELAKALTTLGKKVDIYTRWFDQSKQQIDPVPDWPDVRVIRIPAGSWEFLPKEFIYDVLPELAHNMADFIRKHEGTDKANDFLNHGNYLAYGLAASTLWALGIPHGFAVMHGKTRRGALVFDIADLVKDAIVLPWAFICAKEGATHQEFREQCLQAFADHKALDAMFDQVKAIALTAKERNMEQDKEHPPL